MPGRAGSTRFAWIDDMRRSRWIPRSPVARRQASVTRRPVEYIVVAIAR